MRHDRLVWMFPLLLATAALLSGCGGGSASTSGGGGGGSGGTQVFAVDDLNTGYDHVWVTVNSISLTSSGGGSTTIFDATAQGGRVVDLQSLHDGAGAKFLLLGGCNVPAGSYTGINVTVSSGLTIFPSGAATGTAATFAGSSGGTFAMSMTFPAPQAISPSNKVVVDFNLATWTLSGTSVSATNNAFLSLGSAKSIDDDSRHVASDYDGTVGALTGTSPTQTFTLTQGKSSFNVATTAATTIINSDGSASPSLSNGEQLDVFGSFDVTNNVLTATSITIRIGNGSPPARVRGLVTAFDATAGTLTVQPADCDRFEPASAAVTVSVGSSTMFFGDSGVTDTEAQFFAALVAGTTKIEADGSLATGTLTATDVKIVGPPTPPTTIDTALSGVVSNANATAGTFDLTVKDWEGGRVRQNSTIHVVTTTSTVVRVDGFAGTLAGFFTGLTATSEARVRGSLDPTTMTLTAVLIGTGNDDDFHF